jgi:hypothetical protein
MRHASMQLGSRRRCIQHMRREQELLGHLHHLLAVPYLLGWLPSLSATRLQQTGPRLGEGARHLEAHVAEGVGMLPGLLTQELVEAFLEPASHSVADGSLPAHDDLDAPTPRHALGSTVQEGTARERKDQGSFVPLLLFQLHS